MSTMYYEYMKLLKDETLKSTQSMENWLKYLDGASRNYKYGFSEQLLINNQKPNATAIADYDTWRGKQLHRIVKTGTAMYLPVNINGKLTVKNYFDVEDTIATSKSLPLPHWGYSSEHEEAVKALLATQYEQYGELFGELREDAELGDVMDYTFDCLSKRYIDENSEALDRAFENSGLSADNPELDDRYAREQAFESVVYASTALIVNKRLGIRPEMEEALTLTIQPYLQYFNTEESINALGNAVSSISEEYLRIAETAVKAHDKQLKFQKERELNEERVHSSSHEGHDLLRAADPTGVRGNDRTDEGGRYDTQQMGIQQPLVHDGLDGRERPDSQDAVPQHSDGRSLETIDTVGLGENGLLEGQQEVHGSTDGDNRTSQTLHGSGGTGRRAEKIHDGGNPQGPEQQSHREGQGRRPDGLGAENEQLPSDDTRNDLQRPNLRINNEETTEITEPSVKAPADLGAFSMQKIPPMFVVDWNEVQYDFDLSLYEDGDMVAYNKDGVSFKLGKVGDMNFITSTTSITPMGDILGDKDIPDFVREQMRAFRNGDITADQVREETLQRLESYKSQPEQVPANNLGSRPTRNEYAELHFQAPERFNFVRYGDYYEIYNEKAVLVSHDLKLPIERIELPGSREMQSVVKIPARSFEKYANRLLDDGIDISIRDALGNIEVRSATEKEEITYPAGISHSPLLKGWYEALGQDEELTYRLARGYNKMLEGGMSITRQGQFEAAFEKMSAPILQQSKLTDAAYKVFDNKDVVITGQHSLGFGLLGNGITVWDRLNDNPEVRDYYSVAHISEEGDISWRVEDSYFAETFRDVLKEQIQSQADTQKQEWLDKNQAEAEMRQREQEWLARQPISQEQPTHNGRPLQANEQIENIGGIDFVVTSVRDVEQSQDIAKQPSLEAATPPRTVKISSGNLFGFAQPSEENANVDVAGKFSSVYFRIDGNGYNTGDWNDWNERASKVFQDELDGILTSHGWTIHEPDMSAASPTATKGKNYLYLHPQNISGVCENAERERLFEALKAATNFDCTRVDVYGEVYDMSDEQLRENLDNEKSEIEKELLEFYTTKRSNLYVTTSPSLSSIKRLAIEGKHSHNGVDGRTEGLCGKYVDEVRQSLLDSGRLISSNTKSGVGYRAANEKELKKLDFETLTLFDVEQKVNNAELLPSDEEPTERYEVTMTSDAFPGPDDAYAIWDNELDKYYEGEDSDWLIPTFATEAEAESYLAKLAGKANEVQEQAEEAFDWDKTVQEIAKDAADYTEPFVVFEFMEGVVGETAFKRMDRMTFAEADQKFKEVEAAHRADEKNIDNYDKTYGAIFYKENPEDAELSVYGFRYDVGDYDEERSGLYNHIANYWGYIEEAKAAKPDVYPYITDEDIASTKKMLRVLADYVDVVPVYKPQIPNRNPEIGDEFYHDGELHRLDGIDGIMIKLFNLETNNQAAMITTKERFFEDLQKDERNRHLFFADEPQTATAPIPSSIIENQPAPKEPQPKNFRLDSVDYANIAAGGAKSKFKRNIEAIRALQAIEADKRKTTPEEQEILAHYVGWGGVADAFNQRNEQWSAEYNELKELLTPDEYEAARASVLTAYYTEPTIINAMWDKVEQLGGFSNYGDTLKNVNILEPSAGVGNFLGVMPEHIGNNANIHGVELDSISGRIAKQLYPEVKIQIKGFEKTLFTDDMFDVVIGNVPFSESIKPVDWQYDKDNFLIHDYFFNKALDKVRPGGVVAFITSAGTLDKVDDKARIMMAEKAELLGAIRLPNSAFKQNAGTEVVSDIIFLQKREEPLDLSETNIIPDELDWVHSVVTKESGRHPETGHWYGEQRMNTYFAQNPHMVLGKNTLVSSQYGHKYTILPIEGADLGEQLKEAMAHIVGSIPVREVPEVEIDEDEQSSYFFYSAEKRAYNKSEYWAENAEWIYEDIKDNAYTVIDDKVYFRSNYRLGVVEAPAATLERIAGMVSVRNILRDLIQAQVDDRPDVEIKHLQDELNTSYDNFTKKYGLITSSANSQAFDKDDSYFLLASLERLNDELEFEGKSDIFTKRTIKPHIEVTSVDTSSEALGVSIGYRGRVDLEYMMELTGFDKDRIINDLKGVIFLQAHYHFDKDGNKVIEADTEHYIPADEYLSGNVRNKLTRAKFLAEVDPRFDVNVAALEIAQPTPLEAHEIYVRLGTTWIDKGYIQQFMNEILETPNAWRDEIGEDGKRTRSWETDKQAEKDRITVQYSNVTNEWRLTNKNAISGENIKANIEYGTSRINAYHILEQTLNLKDVVIKDKVLDDEGKEREVVNEEETVLAKQKQEDLKAAFREWIFKNPIRREALVAIYNERFNSTRPREYDGSHITFGGMNAEIKLEPHQVNAVARVMYGGNTLLAHEVGAGKSFEMIAAAMEAKRIGLCNKSLIAVPKHLTGQMASEFLRLYPNANILVATDKTFEPKNRKKFCAKIATGNYDAIIMGHTQFEMIPLSKENQERYYKEQFEILVNAINEAKAADSGYFTVKQMENTKNKVKAKLDNLYKDGRKDDVITFEQLGVDKIFIDEAHNYKNLHLYTKMRNVAGISQTEAQKSADMFMKCRYLDEETGSKGVVFATGTPISNSLTEMYTMQRYLQYETLQSLGLEHFDQWASIFTEPTSDMELAPEGGGYRMRTRCAKFQNLPELMNTFFEVADIKTAASLNLPRPEANFHTVTCEPTEHQKAMVQGLSERADKVRRREVKPNVDNMLAITNDGRKLGLDQRVINPNLPDDPNSKINAATQNIFDIWDKTKEDRLTQVVFCDLATPKKSIWGLDKEQQSEVKSLPLLEKVAYIGKHVMNTAKDLLRGTLPHKFNVYDDVKAKLILKGVPEEEIAFVHDYNSDKQKQKLFAKVRAGTIRVVIGSTEKMGAGTNIQDKLVALHHLDCPWRPSDLAQREGRILRRGNDNEVIDIYKYVTKDTFDAYLYQTIEKKQQFISQIMTEKSPVRTVDDVDQSVLDYAEIKALCVGNPKIKEKMDLEHDLKKLTALQAQYKKNLYRMENSLMKDFPAQITAKERNIENYIADIERLAKGTVAVSEGISPMVIDGKTYHERVKAGEAIQAACRSVATTDGVKIGTYRGFELHLSFDKWSAAHRLTVRGDMPYPIKLEGNFSTQGVITRIDNALEKIHEYIKDEKESLQNTINQMEAAKIEAAKPFPQEDEMKEKMARVTQLNVELSLDAQKVLVEGMGDTDLDEIDDIEIDEADIDDDFEHDAEVEYDEDLETEYDLEYEDEEHETAENIDTITDGTDDLDLTDDYEEHEEHETYKPYKYQSNSENITETFEVAENGGQGAFVSGDVYVEKSTENIPTVPDTLREIQKAAPNHIYIVGMKPNTANTTTTVNQNTQTQNTEPSPPKPKRSYSER